ncbi:MAG: 2-C-methyl-D-erythritol 2,4-cyclodiphosphate synthase [Candidatus Omnitrophota bacterium]|nr:2-C-methyl-D-erythritol 2,4-cyclodiphosphate synthase [Candidatus Omnitrophota bacterium]
MRIGIGYDIHRLAAGRTMVLGGVKVPCQKGPVGHSDGDVLLHAVGDAILGAMAKEDIGVMFPDTDPAFKGVSSRDLLREVAGLMENEGYVVNNLDCVVVGEEPKIAPYRDEIRKVISGILKAGEDVISVKGKTSEKMGPVGEGEAVAAYAVVLLEQK